VSGEVAILRVKAIPGARREGIAGRLGDRLKVRVSAPAQSGRANAALCALVARELGVRASAVSVLSGHASPLKTLRLTGVPQNAADALGR